MSGVDVDVVRYAREDTIDASQVEHKRQVRCAMRAMDRNER